MKIEDILGGGHRRPIRRTSRIPRRKGVGLTQTNLTEGGHMDGVGAIHISEIAPTLRRLERDLGINLVDNTLGSVGKKEFSGDIDVAINIPTDQIEQFIARVNKSEIVDTTVKSILVVMSRVKIQNYNPNIPTDRKRTGYVQIDYMIDEDTNWLKTFYHSPSDKESQYKGAHRNIALGALSQFVDRKESKETTPDGQPMAVERYMFSSKQGLVRIIRKPVPRKDGKGYAKAVTNEIIGGPWKTADEIASKLKLGSAKDINSFETVFAAITKNHTPQVIKQFVNAFAADETIQKLGLPAEIKDYL
jgi:hypothetical protein